MQKQTSKKLKQTDMQNTPTKTTQSELLNIQLGADTKDKENYPLLIRKKIEGTPFHIVGNDEIGYNVTWGKYKFNNEPILNTAEAERYVEMYKWEIIMHLIAIGIGINNIDQQKDINKPE